MSKYVLIVGFTKCFCLDFGDNYMKTNEDTPISLRTSATKMSDGVCIVSGDIKFMRIFAMVLA